MSALAPISEVRALGLILAAALSFGAAAQGADAPATAPQRVVSINLCTDQLAMMLADKDQLLSVSYLALDPRSSAMVDQAKAHVINHGRAEEIYLLQPDLVLAGAYSTRATVDMLRRLNVPVAVIQRAQSLAEVRERIQEMGALLGREAAAQAMLAAYDRDLEAARATAQGPRAALYSARGWTAGNATLAGQILRAAGLRNVAAEMGFAQGGAMPLEVLAMAAPDMVITSAPYEGRSRSEEILLHPVVDAYRHTGARAGMRDADWVCGTPHVLRAVNRLAEDRRAHEARDR